jgi:hypothetical protein
MRKPAFIVIAVLLSTSPAPVSAQSVTVPARVDVGCGFTLTDATATLTTTQRRGDGSAFRRHLAGVIDAIEKDCPKIKDAAIDATRDAVHVLWIDADPLGQDKTINHVVLYKGENDVFNSTLPGLTSSDRVFEIFVAPRQKDAIATAYTSTRERDPLDQQLPDLAKAIFDPLTALLASTQGMLAARGAIVPPPGPPPTHFATVSRVMLPYARAKVHVDVRVALAADAAGIRRAVAALFARNAFVTGAHAACAQALNTELRTAVENQAPVCAADPEQCLQTVTAVFNTAFRSASTACSGDAERKELMAVDSAYRDFVNGLTGASVAAGYDLRNSPKRMASLGVMSAYAFAGGIQGAMRVKVKDGKIVADPLDRRLGLVVVNFAFKPYNAEAFHPTRRERFRWFAGAVVTPDFGAAIGLSAGIVRGLTINFGGALLGVRGLHGDDRLGEPPTHDEDPFRVSHARVLFLGVGYNFR